MPRRYEEVREHMDEGPEAPSRGDHSLESLFDGITGLFQRVASQ